MLRAVGKEDYRRRNPRQKKYDVYRNAVSLLRVCRFHGDILHPASNPVLPRRFTLLSQRTLYDCALSLQS